MKCQEKFCFSEKFNKKREENNFPDEQQIAGKSLKNKELRQIFLCEGRKITIRKTILLRIVSPKNRKTLFLGKFFKN